MHDFQTRIAEVSAPAKINLCLLVGQRREDGYHPIFSVMEKIKLFDTLRATLEPVGAGIRLTGSVIPPAENIVMRAALALERETGRKLDVHIELRKEIPVAAGLAGGSSNAAAVLKLLTFIFGLEISPERLEAVALSLGADVPFFLRTGPQLAQGVGDDLEPLPGLPDYAVVLVKPDLELSTAEVYRLYDEMAGAGAADFEKRCRSLKDEMTHLGGAGSLAALLQNDLEMPAEVLFPDLARLKEEIMTTGALGALMSGSGSSVFGIFARLEEVEVAVGQLRRPNRQVWVAEPFRE